jgi:hypothetical protein
MGRQRAFAVGLSTLVFMFAMAFALPHGYGSYDSTWFFIVNGAVVAICILLNPDLYIYLWRLCFWWAGSARREMQAAFGDPTEGGNGSARERRPPPVPHAYLYLSWPKLFGILLPTIAVNLFAVGHIVNATGGIQASPFAGYAFTMMVLGIVMAYEPVTMLIVLWVGIIYFGLLSYTHLLGVPRPRVALSVGKLRGQYWSVAAVNLVITGFVTWVARPARGSRPTVTVAGVDEASQPTPESAQYVPTSGALQIIRALYGTDDAQIDVTDALSKLIVDGQLDMLVNNDLGGDPSPNVAKHLRLDYRIGEKVMGQRYREGDRVELP